MKLRSITKLLLCALPLLILTGCKEDGLLLNINPDGSGTLVVRSFINVDAMKGFGGPEGGADGFNLETPDPTAEAKAAVEQISKNLGEVTLVSGKAAKNAVGWPGYEAVYRFTDANKIKLTLTPAPPEGLSSEDAEEVDMSNGGGQTPEYAVAFTPGSPATLTITAVLDEAAEAEAAAKTAQEVEMEMKQAQMQAPMMAPMLAGMRSTIMVRVNGSVVDSNAGITSTKGKNIFILADMKMAEALTDTQLMNLMKKYKGAIPKETVNTKGIKLQNPAEPVVVAFQ